MQPKVLIIEDDTDLATLIIDNLGMAGFRGEQIRDGREGLERVARDRPDLLILDLNLPSMSGIDICREIRKADELLPILMLTGRAEEFDRILGLELGADDYLIKPFSMRELIARVRALLRRLQAAERGLEDKTAGTSAAFGPLVIDFEKRMVRCAGTPVSFTRTEFDLIAFLARHPGQPFSKDELIENVWGYDAAGYERTVVTFVNAVRNKLGEHSKQEFIVTVRGVGYRFIDRHELEEADSF